MTAAMIYIIFHRQLSSVDRTRILAAGLGVMSVLCIPFALITISRFIGTDIGSAWSLLEYFGAQIHHFSDYSSIDRPLTFGIQSFPTFFGAGCAISGLGCESWLDIKEVIFAIYLNQGKEPWLFGTFVSDFVGDFGTIGALALIAMLAMLCHIACARRNKATRLTLGRLLVILFMFLVPYWGVFYFRFSIANSFILTNILFILSVTLLQQFDSANNKLSLAKAP